MNHPDEDAGHIPVLPDEVLDYLTPQPGQVILDCTVGRGGHARLILPAIGETGTYIGLDTDPENAAYSRQALENMPGTIHIMHASFTQATQALNQLNIDHVDGLLADLGFASNQMDRADRGFSFNAPGPLDMRLDTTGQLTAEAIVNEYDEKTLADVIYQYGEERLSRKIARKIVAKRLESPIKTTEELARLVRSAYGPHGRKQRIDPATRTFMALRIAVNDELGALEQLLGDLPRLVKPGGRIAIISFHSLEDRLVKHRFLELQREELARRLTRKPVTAGDMERAGNPRSRSAKLRAVELLQGPASK